MPSSDVRDQVSARRFSWVPASSAITRGLLIACAVIAIRPILAEYSRFFFYLPAGARFAALVLLPRRYWFWVVAGEWYSRGFAALHFDASIARNLMATFPQPLAGLVAVGLLRRFDPAPWPDSPPAMARLIAAMALSAAIEAATLVAFMLTDPPATQTMNMAAFVPSAFLGDFIGPLLIVPIVLALSRANRLLSRWRAVLADTLGLCVALFALHVLQQTTDDPLVREYGRLLAIAPAIYFAFRHGWRGVAIAISATGFALTPLHVPLGVMPDVSVASELLFAIFAAAALLLGTALDTQRANANALAQRNADLDRIADELRESAQRNLRIEEEQRRRLAIEIHDELGQNLTAVHTRLKLAEERLDAAELGDVKRSIVDLLGTMRRSVHGLMDSLRPPALDEFGLRGALENGPIRELVEGAGLRYACRIHDPLALLGLLREDMQVALWRLAQEATTNAMRHARATRVDVRLRTGMRGDAVWAFLDVRDDGVGIAATRDPAHRGEGMQGMRDRVLAFEGRLLVEPARNRGTRVHALLQQAA